MAKLTLNAIMSRYGSIDALNDNSDLIEAAFENTLSRDGTGPNNMGANLDMDSNSILNTDTVFADKLRTDELYVNDNLVVPAQLAQATNASVVQYDPVGTGALATTVQTKLRESVSAQDFGADPTGVADSSAAIQDAIDYAVSSNIRQVNLGYGIFKINTTINFHTKGISFVGVSDSSTQTGSVFAGCTILWDGGATPMMACSSSYNYFAGFGIENRGTATDWLQLNAGTIGNTYDKLYFIDTVTNTRLSRSIIYSNGARFGYSRFSQLQLDSFAPVFLYAVGTGDAATPIQIDNRCIVRPTTADMTFIKFENVKCEGITIDNCTFIQAGYQCVIFDSATSPASDISDYFTFSNSEVDADTADDAAWLFFKFTNIHNIAFTQSTFNCGGLKNYVADLVNSDVSEFYGVAYKSLNTAFFNADATSSINQGQITNYGSYVQVPVFTTASAGLNTPTYGTLMDIDGRKLNPSKHEILVINVTDNVAHTIAIDTTGIQFMTTGQVFTVNIKNVSGGVMGATTFFTGDFSTTGATVAPADGFNRSYTFYWNGSKAYEISRSAADAAN